MLQDSNLSILIMFLLSLFGCIGLLALVNKQQPTQVNLTELEKRATACKEALQKTCRQFPAEFPVKRRK